MSRKQRGGTKKGVQVMSKPAGTAPKSSFTDAAAFWPGTPPQPSILFGRDGPRSWQYTPGTNLISYPRASEANSFDTLRNLALAFDGVQMNEQVWFDVIHGLTPTVEPMPGLLKNGEDTGKYQSQIAEYEERLGRPDGTTPLLDFVCQAVRDRLELGVMAFYPRRTRGGGFYALECIDAATIKPLTDAYGRDPLPPLPAYEQYLYGTPAGLYTINDILYLRENRRTNSAYALSRVEMFMTRVNQALRKQSRDMARFTNGNLPDGLIELPAEIAMNWTPKDLADFREQWNAMYAGNDQTRAGARIGMPGTKYTKIDDQPITTDFDRFCLTIACACFGTTMSDLSFTETVNRATAEAQRAITYKRTIHPTARVFETLLTWVLQTLIGDTRFRFRFKGYEDADDFASLATAHVAVVSAGIESPSDAAKALKIPSKSDLPRIVITKDGPVVIDNFANQAVADKQLQDILTPPQPPTPKVPQVAQGNGDEPTDGNVTQVKQPPPPPPPPDTQGKAQSGGKQEASVKRAGGADQHWQVGDPIIAANLAMLTANGVQWLTWKALLTCCSNCLMNDGQTVAIGQPFKSGAYMEPEHNHCECGTTAYDASGAIVPKPKGL